MSGGVDSSVAAALLQRDGYDVYGVFMQGWSNPHFDCEWERDRRDAARVAAILGIPFRVLDFSREYYERVVSYLIEEYKTGRTPNPDVMCNKEIKFGLFFDWAIAEGADYVATGHYIRRVMSGEWKVNRTDLNTSHLSLAIARDANKDQSYFLWTLTPEIIEHTLFPIGEYAKPEVRALARSFGLPTAGKKDSQGICFVGKGSIADFLRGRIQTTPGLVVTSAGKKVGEHDGVELFTIGQRHGIGARGGATPYYVAEKKKETGTLIVAESDKDPILYKQEIFYNGAHWLCPNKFPFQCEARIRYRQPLASCTVYENRAVFDAPQRAVATGQSIVFYSDGALIGGGIIEHEQ